MNQTLPDNYNPETLAVGFPYQTLLWFVYQTGLITIAIFNYKYYVLDSTATSIIQSPVDNWKTFDILNLSLYGFGWLLYLTNLVLDNSGGNIHYALVLTTTILTGVPVGMIVFLVSVASSYGTRAQVDTKTSWSITLDDDPYFKTFFWGMMASQIV